MGSVERRERERLETRTAILGAARSILGERGYDGLTMRAVADRIEYTPAAIYKHFTDREQLVRELCADDFYGFNQLVRERRGTVKLDPKAPHAALLAIGHAYAEFAMRFPEQYRVMFMTPLPVDDHAKDAENPEADAYVIALEAVVEAQTIGAFPGMSPELIAQTLWATIHGVVSIEIAHLCVRKRKIPFAPLQARIDTALAAIVEGIEAVARRTPKRPPRRKT